MRGDEPPELTDDDEEVLDRIWTIIGNLERNQSESK
jgi:hypothetical protein